MYNGTGKASVSFIHPMKYLNEFFFNHIYESFLDNTTYLIFLLYQY